MAGTPTPTTYDRRKRALPHDHNLRGARPPRRPRRRPWRARASPNPSPSRSSPSPTPSPGATSAARPRPARARPSPSASRSSAASARRSPATRAAWSSCRPVSSPPRSRTRSGRSARCASRKVRAVYGGVSHGPAGRPRCRRASTSSSAPRAGSSTSSSAASSPSGDVEVLVVDEADRMADMGFMPQVQKILYRIESEHQTMLFSATLDGAVKRLVDRYMHDPVLARGRRRRADGRRDGPPSSSSSTRWTR